MYRKRAGQAPLTLGPLSKGCGDNEPSALVSGRREAGLSARQYGNDGTQSADRQALDLRNS